MINQNAYHQLVGVSDYIIGVSNDTVLGETTHFYVRTEGQKLYLWGKEEPDMLMYDFGLEVGDTLAIENSFCTRKVDYQLDSITVLNIQGEELKVQYFTAIEQQESPIFGLVAKRNLKIVERIGILPEGWLLLTESVLCNILDVSPKIFRCYEDNTLLYKPRNIVCDALEETTTSISTHSLLPIKLYPNPVRGELFLENPQNVNIQQVNFYNIHGQLIKSIVSPANLSMYSMASGLYKVMVITDRGSRIFSIVKE